MAIKWSNKSKNFKPQILIDEILKNSSLNNEGRAQFKSSYFEYKPVLKSMTELSGHDQLAPETLDTILNAGLDTFLHTALTSGKNSATDLISSFNSQLKSYQKQTKKTFHLATTISLSEKLPIKKFQDNEIEITFFDSGIPKKYQNRKELYELWNKSYPHTPEHYSGVIVSVQARNLNDAFFSAMASLDFIRGVLSFYANPGMSVSLYGRRQGPINKIRLGSMHTIHNTDGSLAAEQYWYETHETKQNTFSFKLDTLKPTATAIRKIIKRIKLINGGQKIREGIIRYTRALDESDTDHSIIKLWGALESTVGENDNSELIIRRCSYLYENHELVKQVLEASKVYRNRNVHAGISSALADPIAYQIHRIFKALIFFYVGNKDFHSLKEANVFLDSPLLDGDIERKIYLLKKAQRFRNSGKP